MVTELAQKFVNYEPESKIPSLPFSPKQKLSGFMKMMLFAYENQMDNEAIDYYMNCPPYRMEGESYEDMKLRTRFSQKLLKYRPYLYDYSVFPIKNKKSKIQKSN